jgi:hypothetical protein
MKNPFGSRNTRGARPVTLKTKLVAATSALFLVAGMSLAATAGASAATLTPHATAPAVCNLSIASGTGVVVPGTIVAGVTGGSTTILFDCNDSSGAAIVAEASMLAAMGSSNVIATGLADTSAIAEFAAAPTDTNCPAGTSGACETATFAIPATFTSAGDPNAVCPPSQAQVNAGVFGCAIAVANAQEAPVGEYLINYASQTTPPNPPTISALQSTGSAGSLINVSDTAGSTGYWWGSAIQFVQAELLGTTPMADPSSCTTGGYGDVPTALLGTAWYAAGSPIPIQGSAAGVTISNDCYNGTTLSPPVLGGTITVPATVVSGTTYKVYLCEANTTPYPINDTTGACGASSIDASFPFTAAAGVISQNLPQASTVVATSSATFTDQLTTSGNTGAVTYTQTAGNPSIVVSSSGAVTTSGALAAGVYTATGTTSDTGVDTGTFTFALTVTAVTTTPPPAATPKATKVTGEAIPGKTVNVVISGSNFTKGAKITGHAGTTATVLATTATRLTVRVKETKTAKKGTYVFTIKFTSGKKATVKYTVK